MYFPGVEREKKQGVLQRRIVREESEQAMTGPQTNDVESADPKRFVD
jgi:hypothetical protein